MIRGFMLLLLMGFIFLGGMIFGMKSDQDEARTEMETADRSIPPQEEKIDGEMSVVDKVDVGNQADISQTGSQESVFFTQKLASFMETFLKGFYEMILQFFSAFANLFF